MSDSTEKKTCARCGLLALRAGQSYFKVPVEMRASWGEHYPKDVAGTDGRPNCVAEAFTPKDHERIQTNRTDTWHQEQAMLAESQKRDDERREADRKARLDDRADERKWQAEQKADEHRWQVEQREAERQWQLDQKWKDRIFAIVLAVAVAGFFLGWLFSKDRPNELRPDVNVEKKAKP